MSNVQDGIDYWSVEGRIETLKKEHRDGKSASDIARILGGGVTRNAVIGKINRLGLKRGGEYLSRQTAKQSAKRQAAIAREEKKALARKVAEATSKSTAPSTIKPPTPPPEPPKPPKALMLTLVELKPHQCKWPIGDDRPQLFCGQRAMNTRYCDYHSRESLPKERRDKPPMKATELARGLRRFI